MACYGSMQYWDQRYLTTAQDVPCEWYRGYLALRKLMNPTLFSVRTTLLKPPPPMGPVSTDIPPHFHFPSRQECRVLILGCGNSPFGEEMMRDGWTGRIVNVDFSGVVIKQMKDKYNRQFYENLYGISSRYTPMEFICADITQYLPFHEGEFDLVICKGSFDAVLCSSKVCMRRLVSEIHRVLAQEHGVFFLVTNGNPDNRLEYLEHNYNLYHYWQGVSVHTVPPQHHPPFAYHGRPPKSPSNERNVFVYICRKTGPPNVEKENAINIWNYTP